MPLVVSNAGTKPVNGTYYQVQLSPAKYICNKDDGSQYSLYVENLSNNFGSMYKNCWIIARTDKSESFHLYIVPCQRYQPDNVDENLKVPPFSGWRCIAGIDPLPTILSSDDNSNIDQLKNQNFHWHHTNFRVKDYKKSLDFYQKILNFRLFHYYNLDHLNFSIYFLGIPEKEYDYPEPGTKEAESILWNYSGTLLELTYNYGTEKDDNFKYNNGSKEPYRGFGHIALNVDNVNNYCKYLESKSVKFQQKLNEGLMKNVAFILDPDEYWIEIIQRSKNPNNNVIYNYPPVNFSQTMLRVKNPALSLKFYCDYLGMKLTRETHMPERKYSMYFLANIGDNIEYPEPTSDNGKIFSKSLFMPLLQLSHQWGVELDNNFKYHNGNDEPKGFGHIAYLVNDLNYTCDILENNHITFKKKPNEGKLKGIAFALDPDGYWVELVQRGVTF